MFPSTARKCEGLMFPSTARKCEGLMFPSTARKCEGLMFPSTARKETSLGRYRACFTRVLIAGLGGRGVGCICWMREGKVVGGGEEGTVAIKECSRQSGKQGKPVGKLEIVENRANEIV